MQTLFAQAAAASGNNSEAIWPWLIIGFILLCLIGAFIDWLNKPRGWDVKHREETTIRPK